MSTQDLTDKSTTIAQRGRRIADRGTLFEGISSERPQLNVALLIWYGSSMQGHRPTENMLRHPLYLHPRSLR